MYAYVSSRKFFSSFYASVIANEHKNTKNSIIIFFLWPPTIKENNGHITFVWAKVILFQEDAKWIIRKLYIFLNLHNFLCRHFYILHHIITGAVACVRRSLSLTEQWINGHIVKTCRHNKIGLYSSCHFPFHCIHFDFTMVYLERSTHTKIRFLSGFKILSDYNLWRSHSVKLNGTERVKEKSHLRIFKCYDEPMVQSN